MKIIESLGMFYPVEIISNPDCPNIYFSSSSSPDKGEDKLDEIKAPLVETLKKKECFFLLLLFLAPWRPFHHVMLLLVFGFERSFYQNISLILENLIITWREFSGKSKYE